MLLAQPPPHHLMALPPFYCDFTFIYSLFYKSGFFLLFFQQLLSPLSLTSSARFCVYWGGVIRVCFWVVLSIFFSKKDTFQATASLKEQFGGIPGRIFSSD